MGLFGFGKKEKKVEESCCQPKVSCCEPTDNCCSNENARFIVLGACCKKSADSFANVKEAVQELGFSDTVVNIGDNLEIAKYGVLQTPALVVDGEVLTYGKLIKVEDAKALIQKKRQK